MLTTQIALQKARDLCASLPGTSERPHSGEVMFYVGERGFASCGETDGACRFVFELEPDRTDVLLRTDQRFARYPFAKQRLVLHAAEARSWAEVKELLLESYRLAQARGAAPKAKRVTTAKGKRAAPAAAKRAAPVQAKPSKQRAKPAGAAARSAATRGSPSRRT